MSERYHYSVNNFARQWVAEVESTDGHQASTTAFGRRFVGRGASAQEALDALRAEMEKIGWFVSDAFARAG